VGTVEAIGVAEVVDVAPGPVLGQAADGLEDQAGVVGPKLGEQVGQVAGLDLAGVVAIGHRPA
jgi:hypothetical protein